MRASDTLRPQLDELVVGFFDVDGTLVYRDPETGPGGVPSKRVCSCGWSSHHCIGTGHAGARTTL